MRNVPEAANLRKRLAHIRQRWGILRIWRAGRFREVSILGDGQPGWISWAVQAWLTIEQGHESFPLHVSFVFLPWLVLGFGRLNVIQLNTPHAACIRPFVS